MHETTTHTDTHFAYPLTNTIAECNRHLSLILLREVPLFSFCTLPPRLGAVRLAPTVIPAALVVPMIVPIRPAVLMVPIAILVRLAPTVLPGVLLLIVPVVLPLFLLLIAPTVIPLFLLLIAQTVKPHSGRSFAHCEFVCKQIVLNNH